MTITEPQAVPAWLNMDVAAPPELRAELATLRNDMLRLFEDLRDITRRRAAAVSKLEANTGDMPDDLFAKVCEWTLADNLASISQAYSDMLTGSSNEADSAFAWLSAGADPTGDPMATAAEEAA